MQGKPKVLFLSTGNSTRSLMAEGFLRALIKDQLQTVSAGIEPGGPEPLAVEVMREMGIDISSQKPKSVAESLKDHFTYAVIVYDPAKERSPIFPFAPRLYHWSVSDPSGSTGSTGSTPEQKEAFRRARMQIHGYVHNFLEEAGLGDQARLAAAA